MKTLGWVAFSHNGGQLPFALSMTRQQVIDLCHSRAALLCGIAAMMPGEVRGPLYTVEGYTMRTRDGSYKLKLRAQTSPR